MPSILSKLPQYNEVVKLQQTLMRLSAISSIESASLPSNISKELNEKSSSKLLGSDDYTTKNSQKSMKVELADEMGPGFLSGLKCSISLFIYDFHPCQSNKSEQRLGAALSSWYPNRYSFDLT
jgi:hypothetical protein